jgi:hypothetical protein
VPKDTTEGIVGSFDKSTPLTEISVSGAPMLVCDIRPEYDPLADAFDLTLIVTGWPTIVPLATERDTGDAFPFQVVPPSVEISKLAGGVITTLFVRFVPLTV